MNAVLEISGLTKKFGKITAVDDLNLTVPRGSVFGILGPNGSGKTTSLGMILGVINPSAGNFDWFGKGSGHENRKRIGAILESPCFYHNLSAEDNLRITAKIKEISNDRIEGVLKRVGLYARKNDPFKTFSLGMKQRLAIASSLLSDPEVMIFDEPTNGLDPQGIAEIRDLIIELANEGRTILMASHLLDEVQKICSDFAVLRQGKKIYQGKVQELSEEEPKVELQAESETILVQALEACPFVLSQRKEGTHTIAVLREKSTPSELNKYLMDKGVVLGHLNQRYTSLEQRFLEILKNSDHA